MTRHNLGGVPPLSDAWKQAKDLSAPKIIPTVVLASALLFSSSFTCPGAFAATVLNSRGAVSSSPPGRSSTGQTGQPAQSAQKIPQPPQIPMSANSVFQAADQAEGIFPMMSRDGAGGQIQESWNVSEPRDGVYAVRVCDDCVYKVRTREFMTTTIILPPDAVIAAADLGDPTGFQVQVKFSNMIAVRPSTYGVDTNLNVYTKTGTVYPFYLRSESFNSKYVPDVVVRLLGREMPASVQGAVPVSDASSEQGGERQGKEPSEKRADKVAAAIHDLTNPAPKGEDFVRSVPFDPSKLHGWKDYKLWGGGDAETELKPVTVYRDDFFTYLQYGEKYDPMEMPTAYVVRDGIDELVNTRVQGNTFIIESVSSLISLKSGKSFLCVQYTGETP
ncbi:MAG: TrbG/VirB9 family P-type conjugative transfer protein [Rhodospirillaceae bacterium]|nr:TrbG/VirB9 family P-type conjugative transfer protein [Rhodospirillaceae bacterium]